MGRDVHRVALDYVEYVYAVKPSTNLHSWRLITVNMMIGGVILVGIYFLLVETRGSAILEARARALTLKTGIPHIADTEERTPARSMFQLIRTTASRPIVFLVSEPVVASMALWAALLYGDFVLHDIMVLKSVPGGA